MSDTDNIVSVKILDRTYKIKCPTPDAHDLQESARYVDEQIRKLRQSSSITSIEQLTIVTALNICNELMLLKRTRNNSLESFNQRVQSIQERIKGFLSSEEELPI